MKKQDYTATIVAITTAKEAFACVNNVAGWWTENIGGVSGKLNDVFTVHFGETFVRFKVTDFVPDSKVSWEVTDCYLHWLNDKTEWTGSHIAVGITPKGAETEVNFTHVGLRPGIECYDTCIKGWDQYVKTSLLKLITEGKGTPEKKVVASAAHA